MFLGSSCRIGCPFSEAKQLEKAELAISYIGSEER